MTRARDELILSHAADYGGARARRVSPFVLEALDLPAAASVPGAGARASTPAERLATFDAPPRGIAVRAGRPDRPSRSSLSFYQIDDYLTCPLKYKYAHVLRVPLAPHHAIVYGAALHKAVQEFHHRHAQGPRHDARPSSTRRSRRPGRTRGSSAATTRRPGWRPAAPRSGGSARPSSSRAR